MSRYAIAYDVSNDAVRARVRSICRKYGAHQQYSLFEVQLSETEQARMVDELREIINHDDEAYAHIRIYSVGPKENDIDIPESSDTDDKPANIV